MLYSKSSLIVLSILAATGQSDRVIVFDDASGLPRCASGCTELYFAELDCTDAANSASCFCDRKYITEKPKDWGCDVVCTANADRIRVARFLDTTCTSKSKNSTKADSNGINLNTSSHSSDASKSKLWSAAPDVLFQE